MQRSFFYVSIKHLYIQAFSMEVDWRPEVWLVMEVSTMVYICTYCILTLWGAELDVFNWFPKILTCFVDILDSFRYYFWTLYLISPISYFDCKHLNYKHLWSYFVNIPKDLCPNLKVLDQITFWPPDLPQLYWDFGTNRWLIFFWFTSWNLAFQNWVFTKK